MASNRRVTHQWKSAAHIRVCLRCASARNKSEKNHSRQICWTLTCRRAPLTTSESPWRCWTLREQRAREAKKKEAIVSYDRCCTIDFNLTSSGGKYTAPKLHNRTPWNKYVPWGNFVYCRPVRNLWRVFYGPAQRKYKEAQRAFVGINVIPTNKMRHFLTWRFLSYNFRQSQNSYVYHLVALMMIKAKERHLR